MKSYLRFLSTLMLIEYRLHPQAALGTHNHTLCPEYSMHREERWGQRVVCMFTHYRSMPVGPKTSEMPLSLSSRNVRVSNKSLPNPHIIPDTDKSLRFLPLSRFFISTHLISPVTHYSSSNNSLFTTPRMQSIQPQQPLTTRQEFISVTFTSTLRFSVPGSWPPTSTWRKPSLTSIYRTKHLWASCPWSSAFAPTCN